MNETKRAYQRRRQAQMSYIGPLTVRLFSKMQVLLDEANESARYATLYNLLVYMKEKEQDECNS
jgi:hypothetical protein